MQQKQYEEDRKRIANEIHSKAENYQPEAVLSVYKPVKPHVELKPSEREQFWNQMNEEEKKYVTHSNYILNYHKNYCLGGYPKRNQHEKHSKSNMKKIGKGRRRKYIHKRNNINRIG